jgi:hypothetical protein
MRHSNPKTINLEWLSRLTQHYGITPLKGAFIFLMANLLTTIPLAIIFGVWFPSDRTKGLSTEPAAWFNDYVVQPILIAYFIWTRNAIDKLINKLISNGILQNNPDAMDILTKYQKSTKNVWMHLLGILLGLAFNGWFVSLSFTAPYYPSWVFVHPATALVRAPFLFIVVYALTIFIVDLVMGIIALNKLFKNQRIQIEPLHPDGAGGLASMGQFSANLGYGIGALGLSVSVNIIQHIYAKVGILNDYILLIAIGLYVCLGPILFFLPLWTGHSSMIASRNRLLEETSLEFDKVFIQLHTQRHEDIQKNEPLLKKISQLKETRELIKQFPVWPFNTNAIRKFFGLVFSPLILSLIPTIFSLILE